LNVDALEKMLAAGTDNAMLRFTLGKLYFDRGEHVAAIAHLRAAIAHDAHYSAAWKILGRALAADGRGNEAREAFERGIAVADEKGDRQAAKEMQVFMKRLRRDEGEHEE
jgi:predicted Zn-dependent protease